MTDLNAHSSSGRTLVAMFDTRDAADRAVQDLQQMGIARSDISRTEHSTSTGGATPSGKGLWDELKDFFVPDEDRHVYAEGVRRGGHLVSVRTDAASYDRVMDVLDSEGAVDLDTREATWRSEGWTGQSEYGMSGAAMAAGTSSLIGSGAAGREIGTAETTTTSAASTTPSMLGGQAVASRSVTPGAGDSVQLYEEQLRVGKRDVSHGRVRLRTYVVEKPVSEQVDLSYERVSVDRRPVDRVVQGTAEDLFQERVIEVEERAQEVVVDKDVRVVEEIALRKEAGQHTETVTDTLRRTEVEVEDQRTGIEAARGTASQTGFTSRIAAGMDVLASDGTKLGTVDRLEADGFTLAAMGTARVATGSIPMAWVDHVDAHVHLNRTAADASAIR